MMRWFALSLVAAVLGLTVACSGPDGDHYIDEEPVTGSLEALWGFPGDGSLPAIVGASDAMVVAEVIEVVGVEFSGPHLVPESMPAEIAESWSRGFPYTTYRLAVEQWLKGSGPQEVVITDGGGITPDGPIFFDGDFLLQADRKYVMTLDPNPGMPGGGQYTRSAGSRGTFEVTDGYVHVLNHPIAQDLQEQYGDMPLQKFVDILRGYVANPPPPAPLPSPAPQPPDTNPPATTSLAVDAVAIDTGVSDAAAASPGTAKRCNTLTTGGTLTIDISADAVPLIGETGGGIIAFQFILHYDSSKVTVAASNPNMLLAENSGSSLVSLGDAAPDADGSFRVAVADLGQPTIPESGSGVLARITLAGVGSGVSPLTLSHVGIADTANNLYTINNVLNAQVAVDVACSTTR